jgi:hypothetical protein
MRGYSDRVCGWACLFIFGLSNCLAGPLSNGNPAAEADSLYWEGEFEEALALALDGLRGGNLKGRDSVFLLKRIAVMYAADPETIADARRHFDLMLRLDPGADIKELVASPSVERLFDHIKAATAEDRAPMASRRPSRRLYWFLGAGIAAAAGAVVANELLGMQESKVKEARHYDIP